MQLQAQSQTPAADMGSTSGQAWNTDLGDDQSESGSENDWWNQPSQPGQFSTNNSTAYYTPNMAATDMVNNMSSPFNSNPGSKPSFGAPMLGQTGMLEPPSTGPTGCCGPQQFTTGPLPPNMSIANSPPQTMFPPSMSVASSPPQTMMPQTMMPPPPGTSNAPFTGPPTGCPGWQCSGGGFPTQQLGAHTENNTFWDR